MLSGNHLECFNNLDHCGHSDEIECRVIFENEETT